VWLEGLSELQKFDDLTENRTRDLLACSIMPQSTMLQCDPICISVYRIQLSYVEKTHERSDINRAINISVL
jgi:hypothetical protein